MKNVLAIALLSIPLVANAQKQIDTNELLCYSLALEMLQGEYVSKEQAKAWNYLGCVDYEDKIAPAVAAYLGSKEMSERYEK